MSYWVKVDVDTFNKLWDKVRAVTWLYPIINTSDRTVWVNKHGKPLFKIERWQCRGYTKGRPEICFEHYVHKDLTNL